MTWAARFRFRQYLRESLWVYPLAGVILGGLLALLTWQADTSLRCRPGGGQSSTAGYVATMLSELGGAPEAHVITKETLQEVEQASATSESS